MTNPLKKAGFWRLIITLLQMIGVLKKPDGMELEDLRPAPPSDKEEPKVF